MLFTDNSNWFLDPWDEFKRMTRTASRLNALRTPEFPSVNTWVSSDDSMVTTEIPGVDPDSIDISVAGRTVTIKGSRRAEELSGEQTFHRRQAVRSVKKNMK